jgi:DNA-binding beta-propeller fold protein YncE
MRRTGELLGLAVLSVAAAIGPAAAQVPPNEFVNFEGAQTNPIRLSSDGTRLFALNTPDTRVSVFDISNPSSPALIVEIPVGIEPVSVNPRTDDEAWVVNQESDSVSIVSVSQGIVTDTIYVKDEPSDVVFAGNNLAFVSVARSNLINVYDVTSHALVKSIPVIGENPRALAVSADGSKVYAAFALSGNHTTIVPAQYAPPPPPPTNPQLPPPPQVGAIVDASDPHWSSVIRYSMPDNGVVAIDTTSLTAATYYSYVGTTNLGLAVQPGTGDLWVSNTDAINLLMFDPNLRGHWLANRVTSINASTGAVTGYYDLNPSINYLILPNPAAQAIALAQPTALTFDPTGTNLYVAAFGTDRVAVLNNGNVVTFIEIGPATGSQVNPTTKRGPRGLALNAAAQRLYVLNRLYNSISIVDTSKNALIGEIPTGTFDPTPIVIRNGRGFLYDAKLSGNGTGACASCHIDAESDMLAWNRGDPGGNMVTVVQGKNTFQMHPMKGPMTTLTMRGLNNLFPYHWRGDEPNFAAFNSAFDSLMGGPVLSNTDMAAFTAYIKTIVFQPNPNQNLDRTLPSSIPLPEGGTGDPNAGLTLFLNTPVKSTLTCNSCHTDPGPGTNRLIVIHETGDQPMKNRQLRGVYQKLHFNNAAGAQSIDGFGLNHDGAVAGLFQLLSSTTEFPKIANNPTDKRNLEAYVLCFDTGTAPAVGFTRTVTAANVGSTSAQSDWNMLQNQATAGNIDLIANGTLNGQLHGLLYNPAAATYQTDTTGLGPFTQAQLTSMIQAGDTLSFMGVPPGSGQRMGIDRNLDGILDGDGPPRVPQGRLARKR